MSEINFYSGNKRKIKNEGVDHYPTPFWATEALLKYETFNGSITEPCCGSGYMVKCLQQNYYEVIFSDIEDYNYGIVKNAFDIEYAQNIVTNPPYNISYELLKHFISITDNKICLLLRLSFLESKKRFHLFKQYPPSRVYVFSERLSMFPFGVEEVKGGGTVSYAWFIWEKPLNNTTELKWIEPGLKRKGLL